MTASDQAVPAEQAVRPGVPAADRNSLVRSEERLRVHTDRVSAGTVRLEKYLVTETRTVTVDVTRERLRLIRTGADGQETVEDDPTPEAQAPAAAATGPGSRWLVLFEEQVVVSKEQVAVERVRLDTVWLTENREISEAVRAERIEFDGPDSRDLTTDDDGSRTPVVG